MKTRTTVALLILSSLLCCQRAFSQTPDSTYVGEVKGVVRDPEHDYALGSATVAIYTAKDSSLLQYTLTNSFGEFSIAKVPYILPLKVVITYAGYKPLERQFHISRDSLHFELKELSMIRRADDELEEVVVRSIPPVRMNGDTIEFNADAFKLDKNAVVEDLMRKLPGITIWGDGDITVNGRKVQQVYVEGKPFFGGGTTVATQNLPKNSVDKIQVYSQYNEENPLDSTTNINIKLKKDKKTGFFGKLGAGYGTDERYAADGMLSRFGPRTQFSVAGATNNINKMAYNVNTLMANSSFKGVGASVEYQPDFNMRGYNKPASGGVTFQHDFIPDANYEKNNRLTANYFLNSNPSINDQQSTTVRALGEDSFLTQQRESISRRHSLSQAIHGDYNNNNRFRNYSIRGDVSLNNTDNSSESSGSTEKTGLGLINTNQNLSEGSGNNQRFAISASYNQRQEDPLRTRFNRRLQDVFSVDYNLAVYNGQDDQRRITKFVSLQDPSQNQDFNRSYHNSTRSITNGINFDYRYLKNLLFGNRYLAGIDMGFSNRLNLDNNTYTDVISDLDTLAKQYRPNGYLTNTRHLYVFNDVPSLNFTRNTYKSFVNRFQKSVNIGLSLQEQFYHMDHSADRSFQNFTRSYAKFIPSAYINYRNDQFGDYVASYSLRYSSSASYPSVNNIAPLIDSSNIYYIPLGNPNLQPEYSRQVDFGFSRESRKRKNPGSWGLNAAAGMVSNRITDSSFYDAEGKRTSYPVNADGNRFISGGGNLRKSFTLKQHNFQLSLDANARLEKNPGYTNSILNFSRNFSNNNALSLNYSFKGILAVQLRQQYSFYRSKQEAFSNTVFKNNTSVSSLSGSLNLPKSVNWSSNINLNRTQANGADPIKFAIWNASLTYRFLRGNNGEVKFSALDILHQNKAIINYGDNSSFTTGVASVLQQYFMVTLSYYPRKFGGRTRGRRR